MTNCLAKTLLVALSAYPNFSFRSLVVNFFISNSISNTIFMSPLRFLSCSLDFLVNQLPNCRHNGFTLFAWLGMLKILSQNYLDNRQRSSEDKILKFSAGFS